MSDFSTTVRLQTLAFEIVSIQQIAASEVCSRVRACILSAAPPFCNAQANATTSSRRRSEMSMRSTHTWRANTSIRCFDPTGANVCMCNSCALPHSILLLKDMTSNRLRLPTAAGVSGSRRVQGVLDRRSGRRGKCFCASVQLQQAPSSCFRCMQSTHDQLQWWLKSRLASAALTLLLHFRNCYLWCANTLRPSHGKGRMPPL